MNRYLWSLIFVVGWPVCDMHAEYLVSNFNTPEDITFRMATWYPTRRGPATFQFSQSFEYGRTEHARNPCSERVPLLNLYHCGESLLAMVSGQPACSCSDTVLHGLPFATSPASETCSQGRLCLQGRYTEWQLHLHNKVFFTIPSWSGFFYAGLHIPIRHRSFDEIRCCNERCDARAFDRDIGCALGTCVSERIQRLGDLCLEDTSQTGIGDIVGELCWYQDFFRVREHLRNVRLALRGGVSAPTGKSRDENVIFSVPLGFDGAWSLFATIGIDLSFDWSFMMGLEFEIRSLLDHTRTRRVQSDRNQTDFLFLQTACARKKYSPSWKFNLYGGFADIYRSGISLFMHYQYLKHDEDTLFIRQGNDFNHDIVNSAGALDQWSLHNLIFQVRYDAKQLFRGSRIIPQCSLFYKVPVGGRRAITAHTVGVQGAVSF